MREAGPRRAGPWSSTHAGPTMCVMRALTVAVLLLLPLTARAEAESSAVIERVVAVVDGDAIWLSHLARALGLYDASELEGMEASEIRAVLEQLIDQRLLEQAAARSGIEISDADVDRAIENVRVSAGLTPSELRSAVESSGFRWTEYREEVRRQLAVFVLVRGRVATANTAAAVRERMTDERAAILAQLRGRAMIDVRL